MNKSFRSVCLEGSWRKESWLPVFKLFSHDTFDPMIANFCQEKIEDLKVQYRPPGGLMIVFSFSIKIYQSGNFRPFWIFWGYQHSYINHFWANPHLQTAFFVLPGGMGMPGIGALWSCTSQTDPMNHSRKLHLTPSRWPVDWVKWPQLPLAAAHLPLNISGRCSDGRTGFVAGLAGVECHNSPIWVFGRLQKWPILLWAPSCPSCGRRAETFCKGCA